MRLSKLFSSGMLLIPFALCAFATQTRAQPPDAQIRKDLGGKGILKVTLRGKTVRSWNSVWKQYFWERSATVVRKAGIPEYPQAMLQVDGFARYTIAGGRSIYREFKVTGNEYRGLPAPSKAEVLKLINADLPKFLGFHYQSIIGDLAPISYPDPQSYEWHTPTSVTMRLKTTFSEPVSDTEIEKKTIVFKVRLYRDAVKAPWKNFISSGDTEYSQGKITHDADDIRAMKTLAVVDAERKAGSQVKSLPTLNIPVFQTDFEFFKFTHKLLREGNAAKVKAFLYQTLSPDFFVNGSTVLLNERGDSLVSDVLKAVKNPKISYAQQYAPDPKIKHYQDGWVEFWNAQEPTLMRIRVGAFGGGYVNGEKTGGKLKLTDLMIGTVSKPDEIARLKSFTLEGLQADASKSKTFSQQFSQIQAEQETVAIAAVAAQTQWTRHDAQAARFSIGFPAAPKETAGQMNGKYPMYTFTADNGVVMCRVVSIIYPRSLGRAQAQNGVVSAVEELAKNNNAKITEQSEYMTGTYGQTFVLETDGAIIKGRAFVIGDVLYQLLMSSKKASWNGLNEADFFNSFRALK